MTNASERTEAERSVANYIGRERLLSFVPMGGKDKLSSEIRELVVKTEA